MERGNTGGKGTGEDPRRAAVGAGPGEAREGVWGGEERRRQRRIARIIAAASSGGRVARLTATVTARLAANAGTSS